MANVEYVEFEVTGEGIGVKGTPQAVPLAMILVKKHGAMMLEHSGAGKLNSLQLVYRAAQEMEMDFVAAYSFRNEDRSVSVYRCFQGDASIVKRLLDNPEYKPYIESLMKDFAAG